MRKDLKQHFFSHRKWLILDAYPETAYRILLELEQRGKSTRGNIGLPRHVHISTLAAYLPAFKAFGPIAMVKQQAWWNGLVE